MHSSQQGMAGATLRAARHSFLGLRCSSAHFLGTLEIPPSRLAHSSGAAQRQLAAAALPATDSSSSYAERAAARRAARQHDNDHGIEVHQQDRYKKSSLPAVPRSTEDTIKVSSPGSAERRAPAAASRNKAAAAGKHPAYSSMSDTLLADMTALLGKQAEVSSLGAESSPPTQATRASGAARQADNPPVPQRRASANRGQASQQQYAQSTSASAAAGQRHRGGKAASSSPVGSRTGQAHERSVGGSWGQLMHDRARPLPSNSAQLDSLDWDCVESGASVREQRLDRHAGRGVGDGARPLSGVDQRGDAAGWGREGDGGRGRRGRGGPSVGRPYRLTHRERVKLCLESNGRIRDAFAAAQDELGREGVSPAELRECLCSFVADLGHIVEEGADHFDPVNISTALHTLGSTVGDPDLSAEARSGVPYQDLAERLIRLAERERAATKMPAVMMLFWSLVRLEVPVSEAFLDGMAGRVTARMRELPLPEPQYVSGILWAFARIRAGKPLTEAQSSMVEAVFAVAPKTLPDASFQNIANLAYGLAVLNHRAPPELLSAVAEAALLRMPTASSHGVSNVLWAFAKMGMSPLGGQLFRSALAHARENLDRYSVQHLTNTLWSLAVVQHEALPELLDAFAEALMGRLGQATPQHCGNAAWAMAKLGHSPLQGCFMDAIVKQAFPLRSRFRRQELSNVMWALATLQHELPETVLRDVSSEFARLALLQLSTAEPSRERHLANLAWACARLRVNPLGGALLEAACTELQANPSGFSVQNIGNIVLAAGILQHPLPPPVIDLVLRELQQRFAGGRLPHQEACNVLWGLAALDQLTRPQLEQIAGQLASGGTADDLSRAEAMQLRQADLAVRANEQIQGRELPSCLPLALQQADGDLVISTSRLQKDVSETMSELGIPHTVEGRIDHATLGLATVDILIERPRHPPLALEVDGPSHFMALPPYENLGHTALRNRLLKARGVKVVQVPFRNKETQWIDIQGDMSSQIRYLVGVLEANGVDIDDISQP